MGFINKNVNLADCLKPTKMCDSAHPFIVQKAQSLTKMADTDKEKAKAIFYYIRDSIEFFMDPFFSTASDTLRNVRGFCVSKSNLQVAMLRAINIPAIYHVVHLKIGSIAPFFPKWIIRSFPSVIDHHPICECFIDDKWIACDTILDKSLIDTAKMNGYLDQANFPEIDWDGENGLEIFNPWKVGEEGYFANLDSFWKDTLKRRYSPQFLIKFAIYFGNKNLKSVRKPEIAKRDGY
jgi:hypothetical protein